MNVIVDTHALYWFLTADKRLRKRVKTTIEEASRVVVPTIVLLELFYVFQKKNQRDTFSTAFKKLKNDRRYLFASLDIVAVEKVIKVSSILEMHDSIILATAQMLELPIVTKDRTIRKMYKETIW